MAVGTRVPVLVLVTVLMELVALLLCPAVAEVDADRVVEVDVELAAKVVEDATGSVAGVTMLEVVVVVVEVVVA